MASIKLLLPLLLLSFHDTLASTTLMESHQMKILDYARPLYGNITYCSSGATGSCQTLDLHDACKVHRPFLGKARDGMLQLDCYQDVLGISRYSERKERNRRWVGPGWVTSTLTFSCPTAPATIYPSTCASTAAVTYPGAPSTSTCTTATSPAASGNDNAVTTSTTTITTNITTTTNTTQGWLHSVVSNVFGHDTVTTTTTSGVSTNTMAPVNPLTAPIPQLTSPILQLTTPVLGVTSALPTVTDILSLTTPTELLQPTTVLPTSAAPLVLFCTPQFRYLSMLLSIWLTFAAL